MATSDLFSIFRSQLRPFCEELGCEMAHLALAWALANPNISTLIAGATKLSQFESNMK